MPTSCCVSCCSCSLVSAWQHEQIGGGFSVLHASYLWDPQLIRVFTVADKPGSLAVLPACAPAPEVAVCHSVRSLWGVLEAMRWRTAVVSLHLLRFLLDSTRLSTQWPGGVWGECWVLDMFCHFTSLFFARFVFSNWKAPLWFSRKLTSLVA